MGSARHLRIKVPKQFDHPYLKTIGTENGIPFVRYQVLPAYIHGHRVNLVHYDIKVNPDGSRVKYWSGLFHCIHCKIMGSRQTLKDYSCD